MSEGLGSGADPVHLQAGNPGLRASTPPPSRPGPRDAPSARTSRQQDPNMSPVLPSRERMISELRDQPVYQNKLTHCLHVIEGYLSPEIAARYAEYFIANEVTPDSPLIDRLD